MAQRSLLRPIITILLAVVTLAGLYNVYGDATEVKRLAEETACGAADCAVTMVAETRTPFAHTYAFQTSIENQTTAQVECKREYIFAGPYACERQ